MSIKVFSAKSISQISILLVCLSFLLFNGCSVSAKTEESISKKENPEIIKQSEIKNSTVTKNLPVKGRISIERGSPAEVVRDFYKNLRERRFKEAMMMTNLRPAVAGLSDSDMLELNGDFEPLAAQVPVDIEIKGEIITNGLATVTAVLPDDETGRLKLTEIKLRQEKDSWVIITADTEAESLAKKEGKNYFFILKMDIHQSEAQAMMERIAKAQSLYAMQNGGIFADMDTLVAGKLLPADIKESRSTGYNFSISLESGNKKYFASAVPNIYGRTGKLSFLLESDAADQKARMKSEDRKGKPLKK